ncbi:MAG: hypothetical protein KC609_09690 [Myxococcales bacterium]|nr:hypothetical protein [Myxococcales bacterium]
MQVYLDIQNVYYAKNAEATRYDYRFVQSQTIPGIPILPSIGIRGKF